MARTVQARVRLALRDIVTGRELMAYDERFPGLLHWIGPTEIKLSPSDNYQRLNLGSVLQDYVSGVSVLALATDVPGVQYALGGNPPEEDALRPQYLLTGTEDVLSADFSSATTPSFIAGGSWLNHISTGNEYFRFAATEDQAVSHGGTTISCPGSDVAGNPLVSKALRYVWGRAGKKNLGGLNDPLDLRQWVQRNGTATSWQVRFGSYPYVTTTLEADLADATGTVTDATYSQPSSATPNTVRDRMGAHFHYGGLPDQAAIVGKWYPGYMPKSYFTAIPTAAGGAPDWSRITWMEAYFGSEAAASTHQFGPLALFSRGQNLRWLDTGQVELIDFNDAQGLYNRDNISLSLWGPSDHVARVKVFLGVA